MEASHDYPCFGSNVSNTYYYTLGGRLIGKFDGTNTQYYLTDAQSSVLTTFSNAATTTSVSGYQAYGPYGNTLASSGSMGTAKGFTGQYQDPSGLDYYNARYYDPVIGCFISADVKQGNAQGMDPYAYVNGNPETLTDPTGQVGGSWTDSWGGGSSRGGSSNDLIDWGGGGGSSRGGSSNDLIDWGGGGGSSRGGGSVSLVLPTPVPVPTAGPPAIPPCNLSCKINTQIANIRNDLDAKIFADRAQLAGMMFLVLFDAWGSASEGDSGEADPAIASVPATEDPINADITGIEAEESSLLGDAAPCSFTSSTPVETSHGKKAIGTLKEGEKVLAYNPQTKKMELQPIEHVWINHDNDLVNLVITSTIPAHKGQPEKQTDEVIHTNQKHPFLTTEQGFTPVAQLHVGMHIEKADGSVGVITGWYAVPGSSVMYNLEVSQDHTFTVGDGQWVVHNCTVGDPASLMDGSANVQTRSNDPMYRGFTEIGRAFEKHAGRPGGANLWGSGMSSAADYNTAGANFIEELLTNPNTTVRVRQLDPNTYGGYGSGGWVVDLRLPNGRGGRWTSDWKTFIGLLNP